MKKIYYQVFRKKDTSLSFPYPPLFVEKGKGEEYLCFTDREDVSSNFWKVIYSENWTEEEISEYLGKYRNSGAELTQLLSNQILVGNDIVTVPSFREIPELSFDETKFVPTKGDDGSYFYKRNPVYTDGPYHGRKFVLTIGVPVSNQIKTIDRCLSHIKPLLDNLDAELLVIDTGSTDGTVEVCQSYNARVVNFPWCDNMSAARNVGIYNAMGEWYLSIDDDEWFEDVTEIIEFFKSGEYKKYDLAFYVQRNYHSEEGDSWTDVSVLRMAHMTPDLHFEGRIHDAICSVKPDSRAYYFRSFAHHYGFTMETEEKIEAKFKRNTSILVYDVWEYPDDLRYNFQFAKELNIRHLYKPAEAYFFRGMSVERERNNDYSGKQHAIYLLSNYCNAGDEKLFSLCPIIEKNYIFQFSEKAYIYYMQLDLGFKMKRDPAELVSYFAGYEKYREEYKKAPMGSDVFDSIGTRVCRDSWCMDYAYRIAFFAYSELEESENAIHCLYKMDFYEVESNALIMEFFDWIKPVQCEAWKSLFFNEALTLKSPNGGILSPVFRMFLKKLSVASILRYLDCNMASFVGGGEESADGINSGIPAEVFQYVAALTSFNELSIQELYFYSRLLKELWKLRHGTDAAFDIFVVYITLAGRFASLYYNTNLLNAADDTDNIIEADILAAYEISRVFSVKQVEAAAAHLRRALKLCPAFKDEIALISKELV